MANEVRQAGAGIDSLIPKFFIRLFAQKSIFFVSFVYFSLLLQTSVYAQEECGTPPPSMEEMHTILEEIGVLGYMTAAALETEYEIPINLIVINNDEGMPPFDYPVERILSAIEVANIHYDGLMSFYLCEVTQVNNSEWYDDYLGFQILREDLYPFYNVDDAVNVYVTNLLESASGEPVAGFADRISRGIDNSGFAINTPNPGTFSHEMGHYFSLLHPHDNTVFTELVNGVPFTRIVLQPDGSYNFYSDWDYSFCYCCPDCINGFFFSCTHASCNQPCECDLGSMGDFIADTPVDPTLDFCILPPCTLQFTGENGQTVSLTYNPDVTNIMAYRSTREGFTTEQKDRILQTLMTYGADLMANDGSGCDEFGLPDGFVRRPIYDENLEEYYFEHLEGFNMKLTDLSNSQSNVLPSDATGRYDVNTLYANLQDKDVLISQDKTLNNAGFEMTNGVSTFDLILLNKHNLGVEYLPSPYARLAADVNNSGNITVLDQIFIRRLILGIDQSFPGVPNFRLFPNYALYGLWDFEEDFFTNPFTAIWTGVGGENSPYLANPTAEIHSYLDDYTLNLLNPDAYLPPTWSCYAIKSGDVNTDFNPQGAAPPPNYNLTAQSHASISAGQAFTLTFIIAGQNFNFDGYQMGLNIDDDALEVKGVSQGDLTPFGHDYFSVKENQDLAILWYNQSVNPVSVSATSGKKLFKLHLVAKRQISASEIGQLILLSSETLPTMVYGNGVKEEIYPVLLRMVVGTETPKIQAQSPYPNPTSQSITLPFTSTEAGTVNAEAFDLFGHVVTTSAYYAAGNHSVVMNNLSTLQSGVVYYKLSLNGSVAAGSFIKQ